MSNKSPPPQFEGRAKLFSVYCLRIDISGKVPGEVVPASATLVSKRQTTPLFGAGLLDVIPGEQILATARAQARGRDGVHGHVNMVFNPETNDWEVGRFGWKCQVSSLHVFAGDAYLNEIGVTTPTFPHDNLPQGLPMPDGTSIEPDVEDDGTGPADFTNFMGYLASPSARPLVTNAERQGQGEFQRMGCVTCHVPQQRTGFSPVAALRNKPVNRYSDLLHDMGPGLRDGIVQGDASGSEWRTAPLWGLSARRFFLHVGRAATVTQAILGHGGEAHRAQEQFLHASRSEKANLLAFLQTL